MSTPTIERITALEQKVMTRINYRIIMELYNCPLGYGQAYLFLGDSDTGWCTYDGRWV